MPLSDAIGSGTVPRALHSPSSFVPKLNLLAILIFQDQIFLIVC